MMLNTIQYERCADTYVKLTLLNGTRFLFNPVGNSTIAVITVDLITFVSFLVLEMKEYFLFALTPVTDD